MNFIKKINKAVLKSSKLITSLPELDRDIYNYKECSLIQEFEQEFQKSGGEFYLSSNQEDTKKILKNITKNNSLNKIFCLSKNIINNYKIKDIDFIQDLKLIDQIELYINNWNILLPEQVDNQSLLCKKAETAKHFCAKYNLYS